MNRRAEILEQLVRYEVPTEPLVRELRGFGWDWNCEPLLILRKEHLIRIIDRFLAGEISGAELHQWAENLELREDVAFEDTDADMIDSVFFRLAVPEINEPLTPEVVRNLRRELGHDCG